MAFDKIQTRDLNTDFVLPIEKGGTGGTTQDEILNNLGIKPYIVEQIEIIIAEALGEEY
jgi:hypothetical protein